MIHRAVTLVVVMVLAELALALLALNAVANFDGRRLITLAVVLIGAAVVVVGFSSKRYYRR